MKKIKLENIISKLEDKCKCDHMEKMDFFNLGHLRNGNISRYMVSKDFLFSLRDKNKLAETLYRGF